MRTTSEIGAFRITSEGSSAANVRRIEAVTGPAAVALLREHDRLLAEAATELSAAPDQLPEAVAALKARAATGGGEAQVSVDAGALAGQAREVAGVPVVVASLEGVGAKTLVEVADRVKGAVGADCAILLGSADDGRVHLVAVVAPSLVERGVRAGDVVAAAAREVGGGGGGRDTMAQAGGRDPDALPAALAAGEAVIAGALGA